MARFKAFPTQDGKALRRGRWRECLITNARVKSFSGRDRYTSQALLVDEETMAERTDEGALWRWTSKQTSKQPSAGCGWRQMQLVKKNAVIEECIAISKYSIPAQWDTSSRTEDAKEATRRLYRMAADAASNIYETTTERRLATSAGRGTSNIVACVLDEYIHTALKTSRKLRYHKLASKHHGVQPTSSIRNHGSSILSYN